MLLVWVRRCSDCDALDLASLHDPLGLLVPDDAWVCADCAGTQSAFVPLEYSEVLRLGGSRPVER